MHNNTYKEFDIWYGKYLEEVDPNCNLTKDYYFLLHSAAYEAFKAGIAYSKGLRPKAAVNTEPRNILPFVRKS